MATRSKLQQIQLVYTDGLNTWYVAEGSGQALVIVIDDQRSLPLDATAVAHLAPTSTEPLTLVHLYGRQWY